MKKLFILLGIMMAFTACKKDKGFDTSNGKGGYPPHGIVGKWRFTKLYDVFYLNKKEVSRDTVDLTTVGADAYTEFKANGGMTDYQLDVSGKYITSTGTYTLNNNLLHTVINGATSDQIISYADNNTLNISDVGIQSFPFPQYVKNGVIIKVDGDQVIGILKRL